MAKKKDPASKDAPAKPRLDAAGISALALRVSGPSKFQQEAETWSKAEGEICCAMLRSALRRQDEAALESALSAFGGLPPEKSEANAAEPLGLAAAHESAMGFARFLEMRQAEACIGGPEAARRGFDDLGEWLRAGLLNSLWSDSSNYSERFRNLNSGARAKPVARCFGHDNPAALAIVLSDPGRLAALAAMEPSPKAEEYTGKQLCVDWGGWSSKDEAKAARSAGCGIESSLLWNAIQSKAWRCAALLVAIPEFSGPLDRPRGFSPGLEDAHWASRRPQELFEEADKVEFSLFDNALDSVLDSISEARRPNGGPEAARARLFLHSMIRNASPEAKAWSQEGTGMGWPEIYIARATPQRWGNPGDNEFAQAAIQDGMDALAVFEDAGFAMQWPQLISVFKGCPPLKEWAEMRSVSKPREGKPAARAHSL